MKPRFHLCGTGALLMDVSEGPFDLKTQKHLWSLATRGGALEGLPGVRSVVLGVNNVLVTFDALRVHPQALRDAMGNAWQTSEAADEMGQLLEIPVVYDTAPGSELEDIARKLRLTVDDVIRLHTSVDYHVACIGSVPGFAYLVGLPARLAVPRLQTPRARVPKGSVAIGGSQTGVIPMDMPSGWHLLGATVLDMFDPLRTQPCLLSAGDRIRFTAEGGQR